MCLSLYITFHSSFVYIKKALLNFLRIKNKFANVRKTQNCNRQTVFTKLERQALTK